MHTTVVQSNYPSKLLPHERWGFKKVASPTCSLHVTLKIGKTFYKTTQVTKLLPRTLTQLPSNHRPNEINDTVQQGNWPGTPLDRGGMTEIETQPAIGKLQQDNRSESK